MMAKKDTRMNETNEAIQNIKMLKLYSWQTLYEQRVQQKRTIEVKTLRKQLFLKSAMIAFSYFFPSMMPAVSFTTYIGFGL